MAILLDWGDFDETFLIMRFEGVWRGEEFYEAIQTLYDYIETKDEMIEIMVDMRKSLTPPQNLVTMIRSTLTRRKSNKIKQVVVITSSSFWKQIFGIVEKVYSGALTTPVYFVESVDEAYTMLDVYKGFA